MNGARRRRSFSRTMTQRRRRIRRATLKVEVVNGTALDTQYFCGNNAQMGSNEKHPVVIGVQSSDTRVAGGNKHPVVTGITMAGQVMRKAPVAAGKMSRQGFLPSRSGRPISRTQIRFSILFLCNQTYKMRAADRARRCCAAANGGVAAVDHPGVDDTGVRRVVVGGGACP